MPIVGPESLLVLISIGFATTVLVFLERGTEKRYTFFAVLFGILSGIAIATKLSALPLMIVPLVLLSGRYKLLCSMITGIAFLGATLPVLPRYRYFIGWIYGIATHTGRHGTGDKGLIDPTKYLKDLYWLALEEKFFSVILLVSMLVLAWWFLTHRSLPLSQSSKDLPKSLLAISLGELLQLLIVAKHPAVHYLVPALGLLGLNRRHDGGEQLPFVFGRARILRGIVRDVHADHPNRHRDDVAIACGADGADEMREHVRAAHRHEEIPRARLHVRRRSTSSEGSSWNSSSARPRALGLCGDGPFRDHEGGRQHRDQGEAGERGRVGNRHEPAGREDEERCRADEPERPLVPADRDVPRHPVGARLGADRHGTGRAPPA